MGKKEIEVLIRAIGWWRAHPPVGWKEAKHILNPAINTTTHKELKLAYAVADLLKKSAPSDGK